MTSGGRAGVGAGALAGFGVEVDGVWGMGSDWALWPFDVEVTVGLEGGFDSDLAFDSLLKPGPDAGPGRGFSAVPGGAVVDSSSVPMLER